MMTMILKGKDCGFKWSAAHLLPGHFKCSRMHGHNYSMDLEISSDNLTNGFIVDFVKVKHDIRNVIEKYDHKLLLPDEAINMKIITSGHNTEIEYNLNSGSNLDGENKHYSIPTKDIQILNGIDFITAEKLAEYLHKYISTTFCEEWGLNITNSPIHVTVYEDDGQGVRV